MLQLANHTGFAGTCFVSPDPDGIDSVYTVLKATCTFGPEPTLLEEQVPIAEAPAYHGEPGASSLRVPSDISLLKPGTDLVVLGSAHAPGGRPVTHMDVSLRAGGLARTVRVHGDRFWVSEAGGYSMTAAQPFRSMPLVWERAYGGSDDEGTDPRNPVGIGFRSPGTEPELHGQPVANLEDPEEPILSWRDRPAPVGLAPVDAFWEPRRSLAGTYDERWQQSRAPFLPEDFDPFFFQFAPTPQIAGAHFRGGELVELAGMSPDGPLQFRVPHVPMRHVYVLDGEPHVERPGIDTVILEPDRGRVLLVWRSMLRCDKRVAGVSRVMAEIVPPANRTAAA